MSENDITHIALLANLSLTPDERSKYKDQLLKIVEYISKLQKVDTSEIEPTSQTTGLVNVFRNDEEKIGQGFSKEEALSGSEKTVNGYFSIKAVLEEREDK